MVRARKARSGRPPASHAGNAALSYPERAEPTTAAGRQAMASDETNARPRRIAIVGGGISGLGAAWALHHHPDRFDFRLFEARDQVGGNAITSEMPQGDGSSIPFDISVTACIPSVYQHILL
ncbi:MAG: NAD(P)-binding protein, partial [Chloroflexi bacterium]|nr:NAD(P)-binding protein [Chloroflexota bacterium]